MRTLSYNGETCVFILMNDAVILLFRTLINISILLGSEHRLLHGVLFRVLDIV